MSLSHTKPAAVGILGLQAGEDAKELSSDAGLKHADLHISDRAQDFREAIFHLVRRLDKIEARALRAASGR